MTLRSDRGGSPTGSSIPPTLLGLLALIAGCGPIEPQPPSPDGPPYIDPSGVHPSSSVVRVDPSDGEPVTETLEASALFDPNAESALFGVWFGDERGLVSRFQADRTGDATVDGRSLYSFEAVSRDFDLCNPEDGLTSETVWLFVSDAQFRDVTNRAVEPRADAFMTSWSWTFKCL